MICGVKKKAMRRVLSEIRQSGSGGGGVGENSFCAVGIGIMEVGLKWVLAWGLCFALFIWIRVEHSLGNLRMACIYPTCFTKLWRNGMILHFGVADCFPFFLSMGHCASAL